MKDSDVYSGKFLKDYKVSSDDGKEVVEFKSYDDIAEHFLLLLSTCHDCMVDIEKKS
jgi:hypothetical protein